ncbi:hypothetical protein GCM10022258_00590 [Aquimarina gracilis]
MLGFILACSNDDDGGGGETPATPTISISGETAIIGKAGEIFSVDLTLNAPGGNKELVVYFGGGVLETIPLDVNATTFTYNTQTVPSDANEGQNFEYEFLLADNANQDSQRVTLTVSAAIYDTIEVGGETLYDVTIPTDGIVTDEILLITGRDYHISESLSFGAGSTLTVEEGVVVYFKTPVEVTDPTVGLTFTNGAGLSITGTSTNPVVMTPTTTLTGDPQPGDWNRLYLDGSAGSLSGATIRYLRTEYGSDGIRLDGMDDSNTVEYVQAFKAATEGIYFTNGNVNAKYMVATNSTENGFRLGSGYAGKMQFGIAVMTERLLLDDDTYEVVIRDQSTAIIANFTAVGPGIDVEEVYAYRFRGTSDGRIYNSIGASFNRRGVRVDGSVTVGGTLAGPTVFAYGYIFDLDSQHFRDAPFGGSRDDMDGTINNPFFNNVTSYEEVVDPDTMEVSYNPIYDTIDGIGTNDFIPDATVTAKENHDPSTVDAFFTSVTYVGAVENEAGDWTVGWVKNPDGTIR